MHACPSATSCLVTDAAANMNVFTASLRSQLHYDGMCTLAVHLCVFHFCGMRSQSGHDQRSILNYPAVYCAGMFSKAHCAPCFREGAVYLLFVFRQLV